MEFNSGFKGLKHSLENLFSLLENSFGTADKA